MFILTDHVRFLKSAVRPGEYESTEHAGRAKTFSTVAKARKFLDKNQLRGVLVAVESPATRQSTTTSVPYFA